MLEAALKLLQKLTSHSYKAYIVGGFVRDSLLEMESNDIDIATNATPKQIKEIFTDSCLPSEDYGSVTVMLKGIRFEITTFRKEITYVNNRKPVEIEYIDELLPDLLRRDFTINALCMDEKGNILDLLEGKKDLEDRVIRTIGDPFLKFEEDSLRILRAIRFATILDFSLDEEVKKAIFSKKHLLRNLSYYRKKEELDKIFTSPYCKKGIALLLEFGMDQELEIPNLSSIVSSPVTSLIGIWSILNVGDKYPFQKSELDLIRNVQEARELDPMDPYILYHYGLYVNRVVGEINGEDIKKITKAYQNLPIKSQKEIDVSSSDIMKLLGKGPGKYIHDIYRDLEKEILSGKLENNMKEISSYIQRKYES